MTMFDRDTIIRLARKAYPEYIADTDTVDGSIVGLEAITKFAELVSAEAVAKEREECAKLCDQEVARWGSHAVAPSAAAGCAVLIRARRAS